MPAFSLHVLPPAFSLPSIDPECLSAIAYLTWALPRSAWTLVAESGLTENGGSMALPCLRDAAVGVTVHGFDEIVAYFKRVSNGQWDLDASLGDMQRADCMAFSSHLTQTLGPLVDLSLYNCAENYETTTRPAYGATLTFPESWIVPPERHKIAVARTAHLGFEPADLVPPPSMSKSHKSSRASSSSSLTSSPPMRAFDDPAPLPPNPSSQPVVPPTIATTLATAKRLTALIDQALRPLRTLFQSSNPQGRPNTYLLGSQPSSLDCHALGLLALALLPSLPNCFLTTTFSSSFPELEKYTRHTIRESLGPPVTITDALVRPPVMEDEQGADDVYVGEFEAYGNSAVGSGEVILPWRKAKKKTVSDVIKGVVGNVIVRSIPA